MKHLKLTACVFLCAAFFSSCDELAEDVPPCIEDYIETFEDMGEKIATIDEFAFQDGLVYVYTPEAIVVDAQSPVVGEDCTLLGYIGGIAGNMEINGENFQNAEFLRQVWPN